MQRDGQVNGQLEEGGVSKYNIFITFKNKSEAAGDALSTSHRPAMTTIRSLKLQGRNKDPGMEFRC